MFKTSVKGGYELEDVVAEYGAQQADHVVAAALTMIDAPHQLGGRVMLARALYQILFGAVAEADGELRGHALYDGHLAPEGAVGQHERADDGGESGVVLIGPAEWVGGAERCRQAVDAAIVGYGDGVELEPGLILLLLLVGGHLFVYLSGLGLRSFDWLLEYPCSGVGVERVRVEVDGGQIGVGSVLAGVDSPGRFFGAPGILRLPVGFGCFEGAGAREAESGVNQGTPGGFEVVNLVFLTNIENGGFVDCFSHGAGVCGALAKAELSGEICYSADCYGLAHTKEI